MRGAQEASLEIHSIQHLSRTCPGPVLRKLRTDTRWYPGLSFVAHLTQAPTFDVTHHTAANDADGRLWSESCPGHDETSGLSARLGRQSHSSLCHKQRRAGPRCHHLTAHKISPAERPRHEIKKRSSCEKAKASMPWSCSCSLSCCLKEVLKS